MTDRYALLEEHGLQLVTGFMRFDIAMALGHPATLVDDEGMVYRVTAVQGGISVEPRGKRILRHGYLLARRLKQEAPA